MTTNLLFLIGNQLTTDTPIAFKWNHVATTEGIIVHIKTQRAWELAQLSNRSTPPRITQNMKNFRFPRSLPKVKQNFVNKYKVAQIITGEHEIQRSRERVSFQGPARVSPI
jgi:hypothetical protein